MANLYRRLLDLLPEQDQRNIGRVESISHGWSILATRGGGTIKVLGDSVPVGRNAFYKGGRLETAAPDLPSFEIEV